MPYLPSDEEQISVPQQPTELRPSLVPTSEDNIIKSYVRAFRSADAAMKKLFSDIDILTEEDELVTVPCIFGTQERAVAAIMQNALLTDGVVTRLKLPMMAITAGGVDIDRTRYTYHAAVEYSIMPMVSELKPFDVRLGAMRGVPVNRMYTLTIWTRLQEDADQILEQIVLKFPVAQLYIAGTVMDSICTLDGIANNHSYEVANQDLRIIKYDVSLTLQTYVPQPIKRVKSVRNISVDIAVSPKQDGGEKPSDILQTQTENMEIGVAEPLQE